MAGDRLLKRSSIASSKNTRCSFRWVSGLQPGNHGFFTDFARILRIYAEETFDRARSGSMARCLEIAVVRYSDRFEDAVALFK